ncbi:MAG TPA: hypothetical protein DDX92_05220 [Flavobacteriales bacterium]|jgi:hypothetical protein|nr:hypothetical protein [Flavobacteriales bacterium]
MRNAAFYAFIFLGFFVACSDPEPIEPFSNDNLTDTSGTVLPYDLSMSFDHEKIKYSFFNGQNGYYNSVFQQTDTFSCPDDSLGQYRVFSLFSGMRGQSTLYPEMQIRIMECVEYDPAFGITQARMDSILQVAEYDYFDSTMNGMMAEVIFIDKDTVMWSSSTGSNDFSATSRFFISAILDNPDQDASRRIVYGQFSGFLYNAEGDTMAVSNGQFKSRFIRP